MALASGSRLGPYEIIALIGAGGMGEVYRARDTALGRDVAVKVLSGALGTAASQSRFDREARALAALNHPHIATLYAVETLTDTRALVMELVEGDTLADRLARGRLTAHEALTIARQIADAIEAAHAKGIVHRDLKPANIKVTPGGVVKVLDFGLAKAAEGTPFQDQLPTVADVTREGTVVGTAAYMSPQQARGEAVDRDADIWAFGCVLFELIAGHKAFDGRTTSDIIANVLQQEPDWRAAVSFAPPEAVRLVRRCLTKERAKRLRDIADARLEIEEMLAGEAAQSRSFAAATPPTSRSTSRRRWIAPAIAAALLLGAAGGAFVPRMVGRGTTGTVAADASVFGMWEPAGDSLYLFVDPIAVSPDGRQIALVTNGADGQSHLWLRSLDALEAKKLENTEGAQFPFWSPDGRSLAFAARGELRVMDLSRGLVRTLTSLPRGMTGGSWSRNGTIVISEGFTTLRRIPAAGGSPTSVPAPGPTGDARLVGAPRFLPDGRHFLYYAGGERATEGAIMLGDLDTPTRSTILQVGSTASYASPGYLLYVRNGELVAHRFDTTANQLVGDPSVLGRGLWLAVPSIAVSASDTGVLAFATQPVPVTQLTWVDRSGRPMGTVGEPGQWVHTALSPDERTVAAEQLDSRSGFGVIWAIDVGRNVVSRVTDVSSRGMAPIWRPRGDRIAFTNSSTPTMPIVAVPTDGSGREEQLVPEATLGQAGDWLTDGRLVFHTRGDLWSIRPGDSKPTPLVQTSFREGFGKVSPDGRWLAYVSDESGRPEIYVRPLDGGSGRWRISQSGGMQPRWRRDGGELFFLSAAGRLMAAPIRAGAAFDAGAPVDLSIETERDILGGRYVYDVADLGRRFLVIRRITRESPAPMTVVLNWPSLVR